MKIGFFAMSGVRAQNPRLVEMGLTLPGFVERKEVIASLPSLGLLTLAACTPSDTEVEYVEVEGFTKGGELPQGEWDLVAISSFSAQMPEAYHLADRLRQDGVKVVLGGLHVSACPKEAMNHADAILLGEGEVLWSKLVRDAQKNQLKKVYDATSTSFNLAEAPTPRFDLLDMDRYNRITVQTQRGCPWRCDFCASSPTISPTYKLKPIEKVIEELHQIKTRWPKPFIELADDNTFASPHRTRKLLEAMTPMGLRWFTETDISFGNEKELPALAAQSGLTQVLIGLESPTGGLEGIETKTNWKLQQRSRYLDNIRRIQEAGITVNGCFVLGLDGQTKDTFKEVEHFVKESGIYEVQITLLTPFPNTPLYQRLEQEGRLTHPGQWERNTLFDLNFKPQGMSSKELEEGFLGLMADLYTAEEKENRKRRFFDMRKKKKRSA